MRHPAFVILYGDLKRGKTRASLAAFPSALYVAAPGALSPAESGLGFREPEARDLATFSDITEYALKIPAGSSIALVVDDVSLVADRTFVWLQKKGYDGYTIWGKILSMTIELRDVLRRLGMHVVFTCHAAPAEVKNGVRLAGGPAFAGQTRKRLPAAVDLLLRVEPRVAQVGDSTAFGWPMVVRTLETDDWLAGSRYDTPDFAPLNLREIMNLAGWNLPRMKGLEWQEAIASGTAAALKNRLGDADHCRKVFQAARDAAVKKKWKEAHIEWAIDDGYSRAVLHVAAKAHRRRLYG